MKDNVSGSGSLAPGGLAAAEKSREAWEAQGWPTRHRQTRPGEPEEVAKRTDSIVSGWEKQRLRFGYS